MSFIIRLLEDLEKFLVFLSIYFFSFFMLFLYYGKVYTSLKLEKDQLIIKRNYLLFKLKKTTNIGEIEDIIMKEIKGNAENPIHCMSLLIEFKNRKTITLFDFFLDYENHTEYENNKELVGDNGEFFFPDFVTENFQPQEILEAFKDWVSDCSISLSSEHEKKILDLLENAKLESDKLISQPVKTENPKGYEEIL